MFLKTTVGITYWGQFSEADHVVSVCSCITEYVELSQSKGVFARGHKEHVTQCNCCTNVEA